MKLDITLLGLSEFLNERYLNPNALTSDSYSGQLNPLATSVPALRPPTIAFWVCLIIKYPSLLKITIFIGMELLITECIS